MPFLCSISNAVRGRSSSLHQECCVVFKVPQTVSSISFLSLFLWFFFVSWSDLFPVCAVLRVLNCSSTCIAACAMQPLHSLNPAASFLGSDLMQHSDYKRRVHFLSITCFRFHERNCRLFMNCFYVCLVFIIFFSSDKSISMQTMEGMHFLQKLSFLFQSFRSHKLLLTRALNSLRANSDQVLLLRLPWRYEGFEQCLCQAIFLPEPVANGGLSVCYCATHGCLKS